jgi:hypothetical protein
MMAPKVVLKESDEFRQGGDNRGAEEVDELLHGAALELLNLRSGIVANAVAELFGAACRLVHSGRCGSTRRVHREEGVTHDGARVAEQGGSRVELGRLVLRASQRVQRHLECLGAGLAALLQLGRHRVRAEPDALECALDALALPDGQLTELPERVGNLVGVASATLDCLVDETDGGLSVKANSFELGRVFVERVEEVVTFICAGSKALGHNVQGFVRALGEAGPHKLTDRVCNSAEILIESSRQV